MSKLFRLLLFTPFILGSCSGGNDTAAGPEPSASPGPGVTDPGGGDPAVAEYCGSPAAAEDGLCQFVLVSQLRDDEVAITMDYDEEARVIRRTEDRPGDSFTEENRTYFREGEYFVRNFFLPNNPIPDSVSTTTIGRDDYGRIFQKLETEEYFDEMAGSPERKTVSAYDNSIPGSALIQSASFETAGAVTEVIGKETTREIYDASGNLIRQEIVRENVNGGVNPTFAYLERSIVRNDDGNVTLETRSSFDCDLSEDCPGPGFSNVVGDPQTQRMSTAFDEAGLKIETRTESYDPVEAAWTLDGTCSFEHDENGNEILQECEGRKVESTWERLYDHLGLEPPAA